MYSLIIRDCIKDEDMLQGLSSFFKDLNVSVAQFDVDKDQSEDILFESIAMNGNFCVQLSIYTHFIFDEKKLAVAICQFFKTEVLLSDDSVNPYSWILVKENGEEKTVYQKVDDDDELFIIKYDD